MSDWLNSTNEPIPPTEGGNAPENMAPTPETVPAAEPQTAAASEVPSEQLPPVNTWTAPADNACTYHYANPNPPVQQTTPADGGWQGGSPYGGTQTPAYGGWNVQPTPPKKPRKKLRGTTVVLTVLSVVCALALVTCAVLTVNLLSASGTDDGSAPAGESSAVSDNSAVDESAPSLTINDGDEADGGLTNKQIIAKNLNSTVLIDIYTYSTSSQGGFSHWGSDNSGRQLKKSGSATGIVWTADGYIITNWHCVVDENSGEEYPRVDVTLYDGTVYEKAKIVGYDKTSDLAVIKVDATGLSAASFGDSAKLEMGDRVIAIGNPGGLGFTSSVGTISGLERDVYEDSGYSLKCLQTDAVINPGNSGGPLINMYGQVVGINSAKIVAEGYEGLGFSIPINEAKAILDDLVKYHYVTGRVSLGITGYSVTTVGLEGFCIASIEKGSALEGTDAKVGDIISYVDGTRVTGYGELRSALAAHKVGDSVKLTLMRYDSRTHNVNNLTVTCTLGENRG